MNFCDANTAATFIKYSKLPAISRVYREVQSIVLDTKVMVRGYMSLMIPVAIAVSFCPLPHCVDTVISLIQGCKMTDAAYIRYHAPSISYVQDGIFGIP